MDRKKLISLARDLQISEHMFNAEKKILVREIQRTIGHEPCYQTDLRYHCNKVCEWDGCKKLLASWLR